MKTFVRSQIVLFALMTALVSSASGRAPNVVLIVTDDLNGYGFYQTHPDALMPHIEDFKDTAVTFDLAYCAAPACGPSRASMLTGRYPHSTGQYWNGAAGDVPFWEHSQFHPA